MKITIDAPIHPIPFKRVWQKDRQRFNPKTYEDYKEELGWHARCAMAGRLPFSGAVRVEAKIYKKRRGILKKCWGDVDNFLKAILDSLNGICYLDDAQVKKIGAEKFYGSARVLIEVEEI